jgi:RimJ/RimL family protein N-acetyltransferase
MALELVPFSEDHLDDASRLLGDVHARHRAVEPLLPGEVDYRAQVAAELARDGASGVAAVRGGRLVGYLLGAPASNDNRGGRRIFSDLAGHATAEPELARDLFAAAAERWHDEGHTRFAVVAPAFGAALVDAWFRVGFGLQFAYAVREAEAVPPVAGVGVRPATRADLPHLARLDRELWLHQVQSPSFSGQDVEPHEAFEAEWAEDTFDSPDTFWPFAAERDGEVVGVVLMYRRPPGDLRVPDGNVDLALAATNPDVRGSGVGLAIAAHVLTWAHEQGFRSVTADWRSVNLLASRFWSRRGWRPTHLRLYRAIP